jgi:predicted RNase H-like nuclease (RuvC/YqgF family)
MARSVLYCGIVSTFILNQVLIAQVSEQSISTEAIAHALADVGALKTDKDKPEGDVVQEQAADHIDVAKINSSIEKSDINTDQLEEGIAKLAKTCTELSAQINSLKDAVVGLKHAAQMHYDRDKVQIAQLTARVLVLEEQLTRERDAKAASIIHNLEPQPTEQSTLNTDIVVVQTTSQTPTATSNVP